MKISVLLAGLAEISAENDVEISALTLDSREAGAGTAFVAVKGEHSDGRHFISDALANGAAAVIYEAIPGEPLFLPQTTTPLIAVETLREQVSALAAKFYGKPGAGSKAGLKLIGVTGTNGKSSVAFFLAQALQALGVDAAMIGTIGIGRPDALRPSPLTTPDAVAVQTELRTLADDGVAAVCMEVSSHGLDQGRVAAVPFEIAMFTNLSQDHLDYHGDMASYAAAKRKLFEMPWLKTAVINADDALGAQWLSDLPADLGLPCMAYGEAASHGLQLADLVASPDGLRFTLTYQGDCVAVESPVLGEFNAWNLVAVAGSLLQMGYSLADISPALAACEAPAGRMQRIEVAAGQPQVVVDYAHTPDALEKALQSLRGHCTGELVVVFGCGGDRDSAKRPQMGAIAEALTDRVVLTDDNPRNEDPNKIVEGVLIGMSRAPRVLHDRRLAICEAISQARAGDCVLIAGKGHEAVQIIGAQKIDFDDRQVARDCLSQLAREAA